MKELRDIKLDLLMGKENPIVDLFNQITKDLKIIKCEVYHKEGIEFIYFSGDQWIFYQDCDYEEFWCNYDIYWSLFGSNFNLEHDDIQVITKYLVEEALKREMGTPWIRHVSNRLALKREMNTTIRCSITNNCISVEEVLKRELSKPCTTLNNVFALEVEEALKRNLRK